jgi:hypothetical protein
MNMLTRPKVRSSIKEIFSKENQLLMLNFNAHAGGRIKA